MSVGTRQVNSGLLLKLTVATTIEEFVVDFSLSWFRKEDPLEFFLETFFLTFLFLFVCLVEGM